MTSGVATSAIQVPFARCAISPAARAMALDAMASGWLTTGPRTQEFETRFGAWVGARRAVAVSSCTAALELSLRALRLPPGAAVFTPTLTFCGAVHAICHAGLRPVLLDADDQTLAVSEETVARARAVEQPSAMVVMHMAGYPVDARVLAAAAGLKTQRIVEDAAHGLGACVGGDPVGTISGASCFSFYATKNLPIGEGGAVTTCDDDLADRLAVTRQHGMSRDAWRRYEPGASWRYQVDEDGLKANFTDLQAAIGLGQLQHLRAWQERRGEIAARYDRTLREIEGLILPPRPHNGAHAWHLYVVRVSSGFGLARDRLASLLAGRGVGTSVHFVPVHRFHYFRQLLGSLEAALPVAERLADEVLSLPMHPSLTDADVDYVCEQIAAIAHLGEAS